MLLFAFVLFLVAFPREGNSVTIMSVDFGSEWMKVAVVSPGIPMEIALNKESKRKTPVAVAFRDGERTFGEDAVTAGMRSPSSSYQYLLDLLGKQTSNSVVDIYLKRFPYYNIVPHPTRGTVVFQHDEDTMYPVEELIAQLLSHARDIASAHTHQKIKDIVITVPSFFNQAERRALLIAAELADLKVLSLMSTNAAIALDYGMFRRKEINETAQNILFYDMGASSTVATIVSYQTVKTKERGYTETNPQLTILGVGVDRTLGGLEMQLRLRDHLAAKFNEMKKTPNDAFHSARAMKKFMKEAGRLKNVLSANTGHVSQVEGVLDDQDFKLMVTRDDFEDLCTDLFERVRGPVDSALISAVMDISDISQFIIVGGNTRVPKVQSILQSIWGGELGKNINADEAAAMGAVYRAADLGQGFKVMKFHVKESTIYPIEVDFERSIQNEDGTSQLKVVKRSLFAMANTYPQKKVMTFSKHTGDFNFSVNYGELTQMSKADARMAIPAKNLTSISVNGVTAAFKKHLSEGAESKGIKAHFSVDESGILSLNSIEVVFEKNVTVEAEKEEESTLSKIGSTLSKLFSGADSEADNQTSTEMNRTEENSYADEDKKKESMEKEKKSVDKETDKKNDTKPKLVSIKEELNYTVTYLDLPLLSEEQMKESMEKIDSINKAEELRHEKARARNLLESYILEIQDKLSQEEYEQASTEEIRMNLREMASKYEDWLYDEGFDEEPSVFKSKVNDLEKLFEPIVARVREHRERPEALKALAEMINMSSVFLHKAIETNETNQFFTDVEMKSLDELILSTQKWLEEKEEDQEQLALHKDPKLTLSAIAERVAALDREIKYLVNKAKIAQVKKEREAAEAKARAEREAKINETQTDKENAEVKLEGAGKANETEDASSKEQTSLPEEENEKQGYIFEEEYEKQNGTVLSQENDAEENRRKDEEQEIDESTPDVHAEL